MKIEKDVEEFFKKLMSIPKIKESGLNILLNNDIQIFDDSITAKVLRRGMELEGSWDAYRLSNIDIHYEDRAIPLNSRIEMIGVKEFAPVIRPGDCGLIVIYRFIMFDIQHNPLDLVTGIRITVKRPNNITDTVRIVVYG